MRSASNRRDRSRRFLVSLGCQACEQVVEHRVGAPTIRGSSNTCTRSVTSIRVALASGLVRNQSDETARLEAKAICLMFCRELRTPKLPRSGWG